MASTSYDTGAGHVVISYALCYSPQTLHLIFRYFHPEHNPNHWYQQYIVAYCRLSLNKISRTMQRKSFGISQSVEAQKTWFEHGLLCSLIRLFVL